MGCYVSAIILTLGSTRTAELSALDAGRTLTPRETSWYSLLLEVEWTPELLEGLSHLKISEDPIANRTRNLPSCGAVPQSTAPPTPDFT